jgi:hypothetical protein
MFNITTIENQQVVPTNLLADSLRALKNDSAIGNVSLLKMDRAGHWVYGPDQEEVEKNSTWAVNPYSFTHGYIAWGEGVVLSEKVTSITEPLPAVGEPPANAIRGWELEFGMWLKCLDGANKDLVARYTSATRGGKEELKSLAYKIATQIEKDENNRVPVITLGSTHYVHKIYGKIFTPVFTVVKWIDIEQKVQEVQEESVINV